MPLRARALAGSLALAAVAAIGTVVVVEAAFRLLHVSVGTVQINRATVRRNSDALLPFELRPGARVQAEVEYRINALGMRGPETTVAKPAGIRRIAVLGDSIAFGYWVAEKDAFPRQLELLLAVVRGPGPAVEVLNFGVPGYNLDQEIEVLRSKALAFAPDLVVIAFCLNDLEGTSRELGLVQDRSWRERSLLGRVREGLLARSTLFSWIEYRMAEMEARRDFVRTRNPLPERLYAETIDEQRALLAVRMKAVQALLRAQGIPGIVVVFPTLGGRFEGYAYRDLHRVVGEASREAGLETVDLLECYSAYDFHELRVDVVHPSPLGHRVAAHAVRDALCARGLLCGGGPASGPACGAYHKADFAVVRGY
jgi:lysophospholipase L1-like esterase